MMRLRSFLPFVLALAPLASGCKKDEPPTPTADQADSAVTIASNKGKLPLRTPLAPIPKIDPLDMKLYRLDVCYFGTLTLRQARDAYLGSLGKDEPSEKKIPSFGAPGTPPPALAAPPKSSAAATPAAPKGTAVAAAPTATAAAAPTSSVAAAPTGSAAVPSRRMVDAGMRAPHERNARSCTLAQGLKEPAMPEIDPALATFAPFALELARNIAAASVYYQREEYKKDNFEKGKELHKKLVADFAKLDELSEKLGGSLTTWRKEHAPDPSKLDEGEKLALAAYDEARGIMLSLLPKKVDVAAYKESVGRLEKAVEALKTYGTNKADDPWPKITAPSFDAFVKAAKEAEGKIDPEKGVAPDAYLSAVNNFTSLIEGKHRALSRALIAKGQVVEPRAGSPALRQPPMRPQGTTEPHVPHPPHPHPEGDDHQH
ncbi:DUF3829 domain-containing protein [Polyangium aurulentum]|uniref:DUF3829 domain-containing protein n=1 Tax=Polyangium aurulentum TaxID=2567896 RepID=UPI0010ADB455|nr:DUF3829 domain-containing protein [Polyangium aurulentum]UQA58038.1 YiiG family protein [Polyangium aurulentum]